MGIFAIFLTGWPAPNLTAGRGRGQGGRRAGHTSQPLLDVSKLLDIAITATEMEEEQWTLMGLE